MDLDDVEYIRDNIWHPDAIKRCLKGEPTLAHCFHWHTHKFGPQFWLSEQINLNKGKPLSDKARKELERIIIIMELM